MNKTIKIGKCVVICRNIPDNWTEDEIYHYAWTQVVNMNIKKAKEEVEKREFRYAK